VQIPYDYLHWYRLGTEARDPCAMYSIFYCWVNRVDTGYSTKKISKIIRACAAKGHRLAQDLIGRDSTVLFGLGLPRYIRYCHRAIQEGSKMKPGRDKSDWHFAKAITEPLVHPNSFAAKMREDALLYVIEMEPEETEYFTSFHPVNAQVKSLLETLLPLPIFEEVEENYISLQPPGKPSYKRPTAKSEKKQPKKARKELD
jgi:hypothetical protein